MPRRKNSSPKLEHVAILPEDKERIDNRSKKTGEYQYEVVNKALDRLEERKTI